MLFSLRSEFEFIYSYKYARSRRFRTFADNPKKLFKYITHSKRNTQGKVNGKGK